MFILVHTELTKPLIYMLRLSIVIEIQNANYHHFTGFLIHSCQSP
jgi:hypothetical protein